VGSHQLFVVSGPLDGADLGIGNDRVDARSSLGVPESESAIGSPSSGSEEVGLPWAPIESFDGSGVVGELEGGLSGRVLDGLGAPDLDDVVVSTGSELLSVVRPLQSDNLLVVGVAPSAEDRVLLADITVDDAVVSRPGSEDVFVPCQGSDTVGVISEAPQLLLSGHVPKLDTARGVGSSDGNVRGSSFDPRDGSDVVVVPDVHQLGDFAGGRVPQEDGLVQSHSQKVVAAPVEQVQVIIVEHVWGVQNLFWEGGDVAERSPVLLVSDFVFAVKDWSN
jgi:hypothetical protein